MYKTCRYRWSFRSYDKGKASQQSNVTIGNDDDDVEFMQGLGLIAEKDSSSVSVEITKQVNVKDRGTSPFANNPVTTQEQATSPIANNSLSTQEQATNPITNEKASPKIAREQDKLLELIRELSSPVEGETAEIKKGESENSLARLYQKALKAKNRVTQAYQEEIRCWYYYAEEFEKKVMSIRDNDRRIGDQQARTKVYDEIRDHLSGITKDTLRKKTQRARAIYNLFKKIGVKKIKRVHSYSADAIASLTVSQMQTIIDRVTNSLPIA
ncbi:5505_t:CDS:2 [Diversispora eburnea]|uniref:5505_t:CDS:1 n=1 Tax=Diversispora eburnea TaxID=1213867 RepID=A0A9N9G683_9GLOM|nr:5505_t:CDS:2 [Diversispora eburnea]